MSPTPKTKGGPTLVRDSVEGLSAQTPATAEGGDKKRQSYKPLPKEFQRDGFTYRQIAREGDAGIYEQTWNGCGNPSIAYEIIHIRRRDGFQIGSRFVEAAEIYPAAASWGTDAFTVTDRDTAFKKMAEMLAE